MSIPFSFDTVYKLHLFSVHQSSSLLSIFSPGQSPFLLVIESSILLSNLLFCWSIFFSASQSVPFSVGQSSFLLIYLHFCRSSYFFSVDRSSFLLVNLFFLFVSFLFCWSIFLSISISADIFSFLLINFIFCWSIFLVKIKSTKGMWNGLFCD